MSILLSLIHILKAKILKQEISNYFTKEPPAFKTHTLSRFSLPDLIPSQKKDKFLGDTESSEMVTLSKHRPMVPVHHESRYISYKIKDLTPLLSSIIAGRGVSVL